MTEMTWQPIDTAPPTSGHGLHVLLYVPRYALGSLIVEGWVNPAHPGSPWVAQNGGQIEPTHWMPLPARPDPQQEHP
jgi:hypothetical protein